VGRVEVGPLRAGSSLAFCIMAPAGSMLTVTRKTAYMYFSRCLYVCIRECMHAMAFLDARCKPMF